jgi:predicted permease
MLTDSTPAVQVAGAIVSWDLFQMLGVQPLLGRGFLPEEEAPGADVVVLSHSLWQGRLGGDPRILERQVRINGKPHMVVGVAPAGFQFPAGNPSVELWTTLARDATAEFTPVTEQRGNRMLEVMGQLKPGVSADQAQTRMDVIAGALARQYPDHNKNLPTTWVRPELERMTGNSRKPMWVLLGAVSLVLLIACANVANLLLVRSTERAREFALRTALGASRPAIVRQMLIESLALSLFAAAGGIVLAAGALQVVLPLAADALPRLAETSIDGRAFGFSVAIAALTSILFSLAPAFQAAGAHPAGSLKEGTQGIATGRHRLRNALVVVQITLGLVLLVSAQLLMASLVHLVERDPGFRADRLLTFQIGQSGYDTDETIAFSDRLIERLRAIPGVEATAMGRPLPLEGHEMTVAFDIEERPAPPPERPSSDMAIVTPGFFGAMEIPILRGRDFTEQDDFDAPRVVIVNQAFANKFFPGQDVIGKRIQPGATNGSEGVRLREIVGVAGNAKQAPLSMDDDPIYYFPYKQMSWGMGAIVLRTTLPPLELEPATRAALTELDPQAALYDVRTGEERAAMSIAPVRFIATLVGGFAAIALILTVFGLYGVLSYAVAMRRREIGVRIALGARSSGVVALVLRGAMGLLATGLALGLAGVFASGRLLESILYGVQPGDPLIVAGACATLVITSVAAALIPAMRASSVDPLRALRSE